MVFPRNNFFNSNFYQFVKQFQLFLLFQQKNCQKKHKFGSQFKIQRLFHQKINKTPPETHKNNFLILQYRLQTRKTTI